MRLFIFSLLFTLMMLLHSVQSSNRSMRRSISLPLERRPETIIVNYDPLRPSIVIIDGVTHRIEPVPHPMGLGAVVADIENGAVLYRNSFPIGIFENGVPYKRKPYDEGILEELTPKPNDLVTFSGAPVAKHENNIFRAYREQK